MPGDKASIEFTIDGQSAITTLDKIVERLRTVREESGRATGGDARFIERQAAGLERQIANNIGKIENSEYARISALAGMRGAELPTYIKEYAAYVDATNKKWAEQEALLKGTERDLNNLLNLTAKIRAAQEGSGALGEAAIRQEYRSNGTFANMASAEAEMQKFGITTARAANESASALRSVEMEVLQLEAKLGDLSRGDYLRKMYAMKGVAITPEMDAYIAKIDQLLAKQKLLQGQTLQTDAAFQKYGITTGQLQAAMRSLPAQMTDIVVSLQSGQMPLTVLLQQGGQIKDMFGSVKAALVETGKYIASNAHWIALGGAIAGVAYEAFKGSQEISQLSRSLLTTNGIAGQSVSQMRDIAWSVGEASGSYAKASEAVQALASSGKYIGKNFSESTRAIVETAKLTGESVDDVAKLITKSFDDPVKAAAELNSKYNFLTEAVFDHIVALAKQGDTIEAVRVTHEALANEMAARNAQAIADAGMLEQAWYGVKGAIDSCIAALKALASMPTPAALTIEGYEGFSLPNMQDAYDRAEEDQKAAMKRWEKNYDEQAKKLAATQKRINKKAGDYAKSQKPRKAKRGSSGGRSSGESLITGINEQIERNKLEAASINAVTEADKLRIKIEQDGVVGKAKYSDAEKKKALALLDELEKTERLAGAAKMMRDEDEKREKQIRDIQRTTETNIATMGMSKRQADIYSFAQKTMAEAEDKVAEARKKGILTGELEAEIYSNATKVIEAHTDAVNKQAEAQQDWASGAKAALMQYAEDSENVYDGVKSAVENGLKAMEDSLVEFAMTGKMTFKDFADSVIKEIMRIYAKMLVTGLFKWFAGTDLGKDLGLDPDMFTHRAVGGPVSAGKRYLVGEKGPELFIPNNSGTIVPNDALGGQSQSGPISIQIDHRNEGTQQQVSDSSADFDGKNLIIKIVTQDIQNDGMISRTMSKNFGIRRAAGAM